MAKILIVEDDKILNRIIERRLKRESFETFPAYDGQEGLDKARSEKVDLILLDLILPRLDGFDFLVKVKQDEKTKNIPVIILSNLGQDSDVKKGLSLGALDYLVKSKMNIDDVVSKVRKFLKEKGLAGTQARPKEIRIEKPENKKTKEPVCQHCQKKIIAGASFCPFCGRRVEGNL